MIIYEIYRDVQSHEEPCVTCGTYGAASPSGPWAYETSDGAILGRICEDCFEGGPDYMRGRLREQARDLHKIACDKDRLSDEGVQLARPGTSPVFP